MKSDRSNCADIVNESIKELHYQLDRHSCLVNAILEGRMDTHNPFLQMNPGQSRQREQNFKQALQEAVEVLEESRKSFKSKQLEILRKKLTQVLIDNH